MVTTTSNNNNKTTRSFLPRAVYVTIHQVILRLSPRPATDSSLPPATYSFIYG